MDTLLEEKPSALPVFYGKPLRFNEKNHRYYWDGEPIPSVTTIIGRLAKPMLIKWAADTCINHALNMAGEPDADGYVRIKRDELDRARSAHTAIKDEAADIGKTVHRYAEAVLTGTPMAMPDDPASHAAIQAFQSWLSGQNVVPMALERRVLSQEMFYAGTCDFFGLINGELSVLDFKTGKAIYDDYWLQTEAYRLALEEETGKTISQRHIIRLDKTTGAFEAVAKPVLKSHTTAWKSLCAFDRSLRDFKLKEAA